ncbi:MAG TPA: hypothetical protein EYN51_03895 [Flavobacteriales bacterium]|nr:hypothetical protein [Flavobacteriales bacterium]HIA11501.1 hypothetical protein [Flavobacteriales bacterium]HIB01638.1 hypothetical protein [Phycisphaerales bacterium]HIO46788.1 hypothetical protein [Candidatus Poribacteria bacterium]
MITKLRSTILVAAMFLLAACPYDSKVELNTYEESLPIEKKYYGNYTVVNEDGSKEEIEITKGESKFYNIRHNSIDEDGKKLEYQYYRGYVTEIKGVQIVNVEKKDGNYNFYKFNLKSDNELVLIAIEDEFMKENYPGYKQPKTAELRAFIESNMENAKMFDAPLNFARDAEVGGKKKKKKK